MAWRSCLRRATLGGFLVVMSLVAASASAQEGIVVRLSPPDVDEFPLVVLFASVIDSAGRRLPSLPSGAFQVMEDENRIADVLAREVAVGTRQVFVVNTSQGLHLRDATGRTRFDYVRDTLRTWWRQGPAAAFAADDLTLVTSEGALVAHSPSAAELASHLDALQPTFEGGLTDFDLLLKALDYVSDPSPRQGMPNFLVFFTPWIEPAREAPLINVIARANETGTVVYPILVAPPEAATLPEAGGLRQLATQTGGELWLYDPASGFAELGEKILDQRAQYEISFTSSAHTSGAHSVRVQVVSGEEEIPSNELSYRVEVLSPGVAFVDPHTAIVRRSDDPTTLPGQLPPTRYSVHLLITFPDDHPRPIVASRLLVDGAVIVERASTPFDVLEWDLSGYRDTGLHILAAEVEDALGLVGATPELSVRVELVEPRRGLAALRPAVGPLLAVAALLIAGIVLAAGLISIGRRNPKVEVSATVMPTRRPPLIRAALQRPEQVQTAEAFLDPLEPTPQNPEPVPLRGVDATLGSDASLSSVVLEDASVAAMHARVIRQADGGYLIRDQGSVAGTWVNFEPVSTQGRRLAHGDLIHVGRVAFRFRQATPPKPAQVHVHPAPIPPGPRSGGKEPPGGP